MRAALPHYHETVDFTTELESGSTFAVDVGRRYAVFAYVSDVIPFPPPMGRAASAGGHGSEDDGDHRGGGSAGGDGSRRLLRVVSVAFGRLQVA